MATTPISAWTAARSRAASLSTHEFLLRCLLAALAVALCYQFRWDWLRYLTSEANLRFDALLGIPWQRVGFDSAEWNGRVYRYVIACTMADVWCGALAFLWVVRRSVSENLLLLSGFTAALFGLNIARLSLSDVLCAHGVSWNLGHNVVAGVCYFFIWEWLLWQRRRRQRAISPAEPDNIA